MRVQEPGSSNAHAQAAAKESTSFHGRKSNPDLMTRIGVVAGLILSLRYIYSVETYPEKILTVIGVTATTTSIFAAIGAFF